MSDIARDKVTLVNVRDFIKESIKRSGEVNFASNAYDGPEAKAYLEELADKVEKVEGKVFVPIRDGDSPYAGGEYYSDTLFIWLPPLSRLASLVNQSEKEYIEIGMMYADENDVIDPKRYAADTHWQQYSNKELFYFEGTYIRKWWD